MHIENFWKKKKSWQQKKCGRNKNNWKKIIACMWCLNYKLPMDNIHQSAKLLSNKLSNRYSNAFRKHSENTATTK